MPTVKCPTCKKPAEFSSENPYRPFCSERCSIIDLGAWAQEQYKVAGESVDIEVNQKQTAENEPITVDTERDKSSR